MKKYLNLLVILFFLFNVFPVSVGEVIASSSSFEEEEDGSVESESGEEESGEEDLEEEEGVKGPPTFFDKIVGKERREATYSKNLELYLAVNASNSKKLFIGAGLGYDDLVERATLIIFPLSAIKAQKRRAFYPLNAYLVDLDGKFNYYGTPWPDAPSHSDDQADITRVVGRARGFSEDFVGKFDVVVLENLDFLALTPQAFSNAFSFLKEEEGTLISNNFIGSSTPLELVESDAAFSDGFIRFEVVDSSSRTITVFYPRDGVSNFQGSKFYLYSSERLIRVSLAKDATDPVYVVDLRKKILQNGTFLGHIRESFLSIIEGARLAIETDVDHWCGIPDAFGYLVWENRGE